MLTLIKSTYEGRCFRNHRKSCGAFMVHQVWERANRSKFVLVEDLETNKITTISLRTLYRRVKDDDELEKYDWFICSKCKGSGKTKYGKNPCPRCQGSQIIWIDVGVVDHTNIVIDRTKRKFSGTIWDIVEN